MLTLAKLMKFMPILVKIVNNLWIIKKHRMIKQRTLYSVFKMKRKLKEQIARVYPNKKHRPGI